MSQSSKQFLEAREYEELNPDSHVTTPTLAGCWKQRMERAKEQEAFRNKFTNEQWQQMEEDYKNRSYKNE